RRAEGAAARVGARKDLHGAAALALIGPQGAEHRAAYLRRARIVAAEAVVERVREQLGNVAAARLRVLVEAARGGERATVEEAHRQAHRGHRVQVPDRVADERDLGAVDGAPEVGARAEAVDGPGAGAALERGVEGGAELLGEHRREAVPEELAGPGARAERDRDVQAAADDVVADAVEERGPRAAEDDVAEALARHRDAAQLDRGHVREGRARGRELQALAHDRGAAVGADHAACPHLEARAGAPILDADEAALDADHARVGEDLDAAEVARALPQRLDDLAVLGAERDAARVGHLDRRAAVVGEDDEAVAGARAGALDAPDAQLVEDRHAGRVQPLAGEAARGPRIGLDHPDARASAGVRDRGDRSDRTAAGDPDVIARMGRSHR